MLSSVALCWSACRTSGRSCLHPPKLHEFLGGFKRGMAARFAGKPQLDGLDLQPTTKRPIQLSLALRRRLWAAQARRSGTSTRCSPALRVRQHVRHSSRWAARWSCMVIERRPPVLRLPDPMTLHPPWLRGAGLLLSGDPEVNRRDALKRSKLLRHRGPDQNVSWARAALRAAEPGRGPGGSWHAPAAPNRAGVSTCSGRSPARRACAGRLAMPAGRACSVRGWPLDLRSGQHRQDGQPIAGLHNRKEQRCGRGCGSSSRWRQRRHGGGLQRLGHGS